MISSPETWGGIMFFPEHIFDEEKTFLVKFVGKVFYIGKQCLGPSDQNVFFDNLGAVNLKIFSKDSGRFTWRLIPDHSTGYRYGRSYPRVSRDFVMFGFTSCWLWPRVLLYYLKR